MTTQSNNKLIIEAVKAYYTESPLSPLDRLDKAAFALGAAGIAHSKVEAVIQEVGLSEGFILSEESISKKLDEVLKDQKIINFASVITLAQKINIPQLDSKNIIQRISDKSGLTPKELKETKFSEIEKDNTIFGKIFNWVLKHPNYTIEEIYNQPQFFVDSTKNEHDRNKYTEQVIAWDLKFKEVNKIRQAAEQ